jgi:hypothetical protein
MAEGEDQQRADIDAEIVKAVFGRQTDRSKERPGRAIDR